MKTIICGIPFQVIELDSVLGDNPSFGEVDLLPAIIRMNSKCSPEQKEATLVHEWVHAVAGCNGIAMAEDIVGVLATELYRQGFRVKVEEDSPPSKRK